MAGREEEREEVRRQMKGDNYEVMVDQSYSSMCVLAPKIEVGYDSAINFKMFAHSGPKDG